MKAFFTILILAALGGGGYYYFVRQDKTISDLLGKEAAVLSPASETATTPAAPPKPAASKQPKLPKPAFSRPGPTEKVVSAKAKIDQFVEKQYPMPQILPLAEITQNWSDVPARAYPNQVLATEPVPFTLLIDGQAAGSTRVPAGTPMKPVRLAGDQLTVASLVNASMQTQIHVDKTNFKQQIQNRYNTFVNQQKQQVADKRARAKKSLLAQPDRLAALQNKGSGNKGDDPRLAAVKASIKRGEAYPTKIDEAETYMWNGSETIGGEMSGTYDTVSVHFEVSTIFGKFPTDYKCLLKNGQVVGWIDPITEEKITKE
ncbi:MAG: hypothetical protein P1V20_07240 [Verrucomicrobiales bacterium]|nr:hypothetical protein [Verrucomicrobiales bacterium]